MAHGDRRHHHAARCRLRRRVRGRESTRDRLPRMAERQGHQLVKSRRRDPRAYDYGRYWITDPATKVTVAGHDRFGMSLDEAEVWLTGEEG